MWEVREIAVIVIAAVACGSSKSDTVLDCAWLASENCWKTTAAAAASCLPAAAGSGVLSADDLTCTYADGHVVTAPMSLLSLGMPSFTVTTGGQACLAWQSGSGAISMTTAAGTVTLTNNGSTITISCPDGSSVSSSDAVAELQTCEPDAGPGSLPGHRATSGSTAASFWISGTDGGELLAYTCDAP